MASTLSFQDVSPALLKQSFITYLQGQDRFKDYNFEASNLSALLDVLIQNTSFQLHYQNMIGSEAFLDSAQLRSSIVSIAKELNYTPSSATSAKAVIDISVSPGDAPDTITIPKNYAFKSSFNGTTYDFLTDQSYVIKNNNGNYVANNITVHEGLLVTEFFDIVSSTSNRITTYTSDFVLQSENIDINSIEVYIVENEIETKYKKIDNIFNIDGSSEIYFIQAFGENQYQLVFGDGIFGKALSNNQTVKVTYRDTIGTNANNLTGFTKGSAIQGYSNITVSTQTRSYGGSDRESNNRIKYIAPRYFSAQDRAIAKNDYSALLLAKFPEIEAINVFDGEEINVFNTVILSVKVQGSEFLPNTLIDDIKETIRNKNFMVKTRVSPLDYYYVGFNTNILYDSSATQNSANELSSLITNKLVEYNTITNNQFNQEVYLSRIEEDINSVDKAIQSNDTRATLIKRIIPVLNQNTTWSLSFVKNLQKGTFVSDYFSYRDDDDIIYSVRIKDNGLGQLNISYISNGEEVILKSIGTIDYDKGSVSFTLPVQSFNGSHINLYSYPSSRNICVTNNKFIILDSSQFTFTYENC